MTDSRRQFLKTAGLSGAASLLPLANLFATASADSEGFVTDPENQEVYIIGPRQAPVTIVMDKNKKGVDATSLCYEDIPPDDMIPVHKHLNEVEIIFIQKGSGIFHLGEKQFEVKEGSAAFVPKGVWHGIKNTGSETLRMMFSYTPSGFEGYFREIGAPKGKQWKPLSSEEFDAIDKKYGIVYRG